MNAKLAKRLRKQAKQETKDYPVKRGLTQMMNHGKIVCLVNVPSTERHRYRQLKQRTRG